MAKPGTKPKPTSLKQLAGNPGKRALPESEPLPQTELGAMPIDRLTPEAQQAWIRFKVELDALGLVTGLDAASFEAMCFHYGEAQRNYEKVRRQGSVITGAHGGPIRNPADIAFLQHSKAYLQLATEFGMTPSSRVRLSSKTDSQKEQSLAELLFEEVHGEGTARNPLVDLVGKRAASALRKAGYGSLALASTAAKEGIELEAIPGIGPATVRKLQQT